MSSENSEQSAPPSDGILCLMVDLTENAFSKGLSDPRFEVVVSVGGLLYSGRICSRHEYFNHNPTLATMWEALNKPDASKETDSSASLGVGNDTSHPLSLHLAEARAYSPGQDPIPGDGPGVYWRLRLSAIDGFTLGALRTTSSE